MTRTNGCGSPAAPLLPGEARRSDVLDDAEHWVAVYEELIHFLLEVREPNYNRVASFCTRLDYWRHRRDELAGEPSTSGPRGGRPPGRPTVERFG